MAEQLMDELEKAAQIILAAPNLITTEQRHNAEEVFLNFQRLKSPYELCKQILETNTNDYIVFEAVGLIKIALIREWLLLSQTHISSLRDYLLHYVMNKPNLPPYIEGSILQLIALLIKKGTVNDSGQTRQAILEEIENLIMTGDLPKKLVGYNLIFIITQEYVFNFTYVNIGLSLKTHFNEKKTFQDIDLKRIFMFCSGEIEKLIKKDVEEDSITLLKPLHQILEKLDVFNILVQVDIECVSLEMDINWQRILLVPAVIDLMFTLYSKIRKNPQLAHYARACLVQMVHMKRNYEYNETKIEKEYVIIYVERFLEFITGVNIIDEEANTIAHIFKKLFAIFDKRFNFLPIKKFKTLVEQMSQVTCTFLKNLAQKESLYVSECLYKEAVDVIFSAWISILTSDEKLISREFLKPLIVQVFDTYLHCHLSPPEGIRNFEDKDLEKKILDEKDTDLENFRRQIDIIGMFGRLIPDYTLPLLAQLIEDRTSKLQEIFNKLVKQTESLHTMKNDSLPRLYKDIHWLILIMGGVICCCSFSGFSLIPNEIIRYDIEQIKEGNVDTTLTLKFFASSRNISIDIATESLDHVIRLVASVFRLCAIEKAAMFVLSDNILSPELCLTITSFLHMWSSQYLLSLKYFYNEMSPIFLKCFGGDNQILTWALNFLFEKIEFNINAFKNEPVILERTMEMLISVTRGFGKATYVLNSKGLESIINLATKEHDLPQVVKRGLMRSVVQVGLDAEVDQSYWSHTLQPLIDKFKQIISNEKFLQCYHQEEIKIQVIDILERFIGVVQATIPLSKDTLLFHNIHPILSELPNLISLYHNYQAIQLILELLFDYAHRTRPILLYITEIDAALASEIYLSAMRNYISCNISRLTIDSIAEEGNYQDILLPMKILINIVSNNMLRNETMSSQGLTIIMPMIIDLLKFPDLCLQYFKMTLSFCKNNPQKVLDLPSELLQPLLTSMKLGLFSFGSAVTKLCCNMIEILVKQIIKNVNKGRPKNEIMAPFLNLVITAILTRQVDLSFISDVCISVFYLTHCYQDEYNQIVQNHLSTQSDEQVAQTLDNGLKKLTKRMNFLWRFDDDAEIKFRDSYDEFFANLLIF